VAGGWRGTVWRALVAAAGCGGVLHGRPQLSADPVDGETLLLLVSGDEALVDEVLAELPAPAPAAAARASAASATRPPPHPRGTVPPIPGASPLVLLLLHPVAQPVCVAEPFGRVTVDLLALDGGYLAPVPAFFSPLLAQAGELDPLLAYGAAAGFSYRALSYEPQEQLTIQAVAPPGGLGTALVGFPVRHCLKGTWQDGDRVVTVTQVLDHLSAALTSGTIRGETGGFDFTGDFVTPERFEGSDLKVCNPDECVDAGLLGPSVRVDYSAVVALDGQSADVSWESEQFDFVYEGDVLVACPSQGVFEPRTFTIQRLSFGPGVP
jgi:hypothetical protein